MHNKILIVLILSIQVCFGQSWKLDTILPAEKVSQVYVDHLDNIYLVKEWSVFKWTSNFKETFVYNNPGLGEITYLNVFNPFNVLVYFQDYNQYVFLDNKINPNLNLFDPATEGYYDVQLAATFDENDIWFFDQVSDKLYKWSLSQNRELSASLQVSQITGSNVRPNYIWATLKNVYLNIPDVGIIVFDNFGSYIRTVPLLDLDRFFLTESSFVFKNSEELEWYNTFTKAFKKRKFPETEMDDFCFAKGKMYLLKNDELKIYSLVD